MIRLSVSRQGNKFVLEKDGKTFRRVRSKLLAKAISLLLPYAIEHYDVRENDSKYGYRVYEINCDSFFADFMEYLFKGGRGNLQKAIGVLKGVV